MKKLTLIFTLLVSTVMFSSPSYAEWTKIASNNVAIFSVDFDRIRKRNGYVYWWHVGDLHKPSKTGGMSFKVYNQGDCNLFRHKVLSIFLYNEPMGVGTPSSTSNTPLNLANLS